MLVKRYVLYIHGIHGIHTFNQNFSGVGFLNISELIPEASCETYTRTPITDGFRSTLETISAKSEQMTFRIIPLVSLKAL